MRLLFSMPQHLLNVVVARELLDQWNPWIESLTHDENTPNLLPTDSVVQEHCWESSALQQLGKCAVHMRLAAHGTLNLFHSVDSGL